MSDGVPNGIARGVDEGVSVKGVALSVDDFPFILPVGGDRNGAERPSVDDCSDGGARKRLDEPASRMGGFPFKVSVLDGGSGARNADDDVHAPAAEEEDARKSLRNVPPNEDVSDSRLLRNSSRTRSASFWSSPSPI